MNPSSKAHIEHTLEQHVDSLLGNNVLCIMYTWIYEAGVPWLGRRPTGRQGRDGSATSFPSPLFLHSQCINASWSVHRWWCVVQRLGGRRLWHVCSLLMYSIVRRAVCSPSMVPLPLRHTCVLATAVHLLCIRCRIPSAAKAVLVRLRQRMKLHRWQAISRAGIVYNVLLQEGCIIHGCAPSGVCCAHCIRGTNRPWDSNWPLIAVHRSVFRVGGWHQLVGLMGVWRRCAAVQVLPPTHLLHVGARCCRQTSSCPLPAGNVCHLMGCILW